MLIHDISDHFPSILLVDDIFVDKKEPRSIVSHDITDCRIAAIQDNINKSGLIPTLKSMNANEGYNYLHALLTDLLDKHIPTTEIKIHAKRHVSEPWLTKGLVKCGKKQLKLFHKSLKSRNKDDEVNYHA